MMVEDIVALLLLAGSVGLMMVANRMEGRSAKKLKKWARNELDD